MDATEPEYEICWMVRSHGDGRRGGRKCEISTMHCYTNIIHTTPAKQTNRILICMKCMENGANVDCLLMRKVPQPRYQYCMNIEQMKNRHRKQTRGSIFGGIVSEMRRSLGGAKISQVLDVNNALDKSSIPSAKQKKRILICMKCMKNGCEC